MAAQAVVVPEHVVDIVFALVEENNDRYMGEDDEIRVDVLKYDKYVVSRFSPYVGRAKQLTAAYDRVRRMIPKHVTERIVERKHAALEAECAELTKRLAQIKMIV